MLINCTECQSQVSDKALQCPKCANPISQPTTLVEASSKKLKKQMLKAFLVCVASTIIGAVGIGAGTPSLCVVGGVGLVIGFFWALIVNIRIWWHHG